MMIDDLIEAVDSLSSILDEENDRLRDPRFEPLPGSLIAAKLRHVGLIEASGVRLSEAAASSPNPVDRDGAGQLGAMIPDLVAKLELNAGLLQRRIALCDDLMGAIAAEARRLTGGRSRTYGAQGLVLQSEQATPISINSRF